MRMEIEEEMEIIGLVAKFQYLLTLSSFSHFQWDILFGNNCRIDHLKY